MLICGIKKPNDDSIGNNILQEQMCPTSESVVINP